MKKLLILISFAFTASVFSQDWPVKKQVADRKARGVGFVQMPVFTLAGNRKLQLRGTYQVLKLKETFSKELLERRPSAIQVAIPVSNNETINCDLVKFDLGNVKFTENDKDIIDNVKIPVTYRGIVSGEGRRNNVILTVNEDYLSLVATFTDKTIQVTKADETDKATYRLYNSERVKFPEVDFNCGTADKPVTEIEKRIQSGSYVSRPGAVEDKCVNVFVDCFDSLYQWRSSNVQQTINYVYELFNAVATGYANERVNVQLTTVNVWTTTDPYRGDTRDNALADLAANYKDNFWGNICVGLDYSINAPRKRSGLASSIGRVKAQSTNTCPAYTVEDNPFCYNDLNYTSIATVQGFPNGPNTTGAAIYLVMHEMGHLLGVRHTKWCGWKLTSNPDTFGALDSCGSREGNCGPGAAPPATGATIMSYCLSNNSASDFVGFNNGFGTLPGDALRNFVEQAACIPSCLACITALTPEKNNSAPFNTETSGSPPLKDGVPKDFGPEKFIVATLRDRVAAKLLRTKRPAF